MSAIRFTLPIAAMPTQFGGKRMMIRGGKPIFFKDKAVTSYEASITLLARQHRPATPMEGPLCFGVAFILPRPQSLCRKKDPTGLIPCTKRPDFDNLTKGILDPLTKLGFWLDDSQIVEAHVRKFYAEMGQAPRIEIAIDTATAIEAVMREFEL